MDRLAVRRAASPMLRVFLVAKDRLVSRPYVQALQDVGIPAEWAPTVADLPSKMGGAAPGATTVVMILDSPGRELDPATLMNLVATSAATATSRAVQHTPQLGPKGAHHGQRTHRHHRSRKRRWRARTRAHG